MSEVLTSIFIWVFLPSLVVFVYTYAAFDHLWHKLLSAALIVAIGLGSVAVVVQSEFWVQDSSPTTRTMLILLYSVLSLSLGTSMFAGALLYSRRHKLALDHLAKTVEDEKAELRMRPKQQLLQALGKDGITPEIFKKLSE